MGDRTQPFPSDLPMLPRIYRLASIHTRPDAAGCLHHSAHLFHTQAAFKACWTSGKLDPSLVSGTLVSPRWCGSGRREDGGLAIARLVVLERPVGDLCLFQTVLPGWKVERGIVDRAHQAWQELPAQHRLLFNAIFWEGGRFRRFCTGPSSMGGHHAGHAGNLRHTVEVAELVRHLATDRAYVDRHLAVLAALLHDAGKADEYRLRADGSWALSDRGRLIGHRFTLIEWVAAAIDRWRIPFPKDQELALKHLFSAVAHAPAWMGLREPQIAEAELLSIADRLSGSDDLMRLLLPESPGWGAYHRHMGRRPYRVAAV